MRSLCFLVFFYFLTGNAQVINFPDLNFKAKLLLANPNIAIAQNLDGVFFKIDANNNGEIEVSEALQVSYLNLYESSLSSLEGINNFINLQTIYCYSNELSSLDVTALTNLKILDCRFNQLKALNVAGLANLELLFCGSNLLSSLNTDGLTNLQNLYCDMNQLESLDASNLTSLKNLNSNFNEPLASLNVENCTSLEILTFGINQISNIDLSTNVNLKRVATGVNQLTSLDVSNLIHLEELLCSGSNITSLDVSNCHVLNNLSCRNNQFLSTLLIKNGIDESTLIFEGNPNLTYICADFSQLAQVQDLITSYGYTNCNLDSTCSLNASSFDNINDLVVYPNPAATILNIEIKQDIAITSINIYNTLGQLVLVIPNAQQAKYIDVSALKTGNYFLKINSDQGSSATRFVRN